MTNKTQLTQFRSLNTRKGGGPHEAAALLACGGLRSEVLAMGMATTKQSQKKLSAKIAKVKRHEPSLSNKQAVGKAAGILRNRKKR